MLTKRIQEMKAKHVAAGLAILIGCGSGGMALAAPEKLNANLSGAEGAPQKAFSLQSQEKKERDRPEKMAASDRPSPVEEHKGKNNPLPLTEIHLGPETVNGKKISNLLNEMRIEELELQVDKLKQQRKKIKDEALSESLNEENQAAIERLKEEHAKEISRIHAQYESKVRSINHSLGQIKKMLSKEKQTSSVNITDITMFNGTYEATFLVDGDTYKKEAGEVIREMKILSIDKGKAIVEMKGGAIKELVPVSPHKIPKQESNNTYLIGLIGSLKAEIPDLNSQMQNNNCPATTTQATATPFGGRSSAFMP